MKFDKEWFYLCAKKAMEQKLKNELILEEAVISQRQGQEKMKLKNKVGVSWDSENVVTFDFLG